jgi:beta-phosphoglucomutase-like phosphatase (HAD superfamily)
VAARAAGMHCIGVPNIYTRNQDLGVADMVLPTLAGDEALAAIVSLLA